MKTIKKPGFNLHIIPNNNFKTVSIKFMFWNKLKEEDLTYRSLLMDILLFSSCKYKTKEEITKKKQDLYNLGVDYNIYRRGSIIVSEINASILHDKYTEKDNIKNSIEFIFECINNPNIKDNKFDKTSFDICKDSLESDLKIEFDTPDYIAYKEFKKMINPKLRLNSIYGDLKDLKKITRESLYKYYKKFFKNNNIDVFIIGDINEKEITKEFDKHLNLKEKDIPKTNPSLSYNKKYSEKVKSYPFSQSKLLMGASLKKLNNYEKKYAVVLYNIILGSGPASKLFTTVREKFSYCYSISSSSSRLDEMLMIRSGISKENFENTKKEVLKQMDDMKKGNFSKKILKQSKEYVLSTIKQINDSQWSIMDNYVSVLYFGLDDIKTAESKIKEVTKEDIVKVANKIKIDTVFLLKGDLDEEN